MLNFPIRMIERDSVYLRAFDIARLLRTSKAYDALYLGVAEIEDAELLTVDRGMSDAAAQLGIPATFVE